MDEALDLTHRHWLGRGDAGPAHRECDQRHDSHGHSLHHGALILNQASDGECRRRLRPEESWRTQEHGHQCGGESRRSVSHRASSLSRSP